MSDNEKGLDTFTGVEGVFARPTGNLFDFY